MDPRLIHDGRDIDWLLDERLRRIVALLEELNDKLDRIAEQMRRTAHPQER